jgi:hypothetical protein
MSRGLAGRIAAAWTDPAGSWAAERGAGEGRLGAFAFGAALFQTLARAAAETLAPSVAAADRMAFFAATALIGLSFGVLALYVAAALIRVICRLLGGAGGWAEMRLALFWSGLAAGPALAALHALGAALGAPAAGALAGGAVWAILLAPMLAVAEGFARRRVYAVFAALAVISAALSAAA